MDYEKRFENNKYQLIPPTWTNFVSFHICEAPSQRVALKLHRIYFMFVTKVTAQPPKCQVPDKITPTVSVFVFSITQGSHEDSKFETYFPTFLQLSFSKLSVSKLKKQYLVWGLEMSRQMLHTLKRN